MKWVQRLLSIFQHRTKRDFLDYEINIIGRNAIENDSDSRDRVALSLKICEALLIETWSLIKGDHHMTNRNIMHIAAQHNAYIIVEEMRKKLPFDKLKGLILEGDKNKKSAIEIATEQGHVKTLDEMVRDDKAILNQTKGGKTVLAKTAIKQKHLHVLEYLVKNDIEAITMEVISQAVNEGSIRIFQFLVNLRPSLLEQDDCCLLHEAVERKQLGIVKRLVKLRPNLVSGYRKDPTDSTALPRPVLSYTDQSDEGKEIYDYLLPVIIERSEVSDIRQHLLGLSCN
ncbi:hypothetical protein BFJ70_g16929 [Fusarium oxysporum]|nr:hypothetical protein BFJ70_g16929 [Fusarium oxysporum]